jgi:sigma-B regulation protein RsbU (phosphoserine phosphatase)
MADELQSENLKLQRTVNELRILNEISTAISATLGVDEITRLIVQKCMKHLEAEQGAIWLLVEGDNKVTPKTHLRIMDQEFKGIPYKIGVSLTGWVTKNHIPLLVDNLKEDARFSYLAEEYDSIRCFVAVPLTIKNRIIGLLCLFNKKTGGAFTSEDVRLLSIVAIQSAQVIENARLYDEELKLRELENDLKIAQHIQLKLLPDRNPSIENLDVAGLSVPARMVGGDYYDYIDLRDNRLGLAIADVSGKGTSAALLMASLQTCLRGQSGMNRDIRETILKVNQMFYKFLETGKFISLIFGVLDTNNFTFNYVNAGHNYPMFVKKNGLVDMLEESDIILGINQQAEYNEKEIVLNPGEMILLYTDGITEATSPEGEMYGEERLMNLLRVNHTLSAYDLSQKILESVKNFQADTDQDDDITLMVVKRL